MKHLTTQTRLSRVAEPFLSIIARAMAKDRRTVLRRSARCWRLLDGQKRPVQPVQYTVPPTIPVCDCCTASSLWIVPKKPLAWRAASVCRPAQELERTLLLPSWFKIAMIGAIVLLGLMTMTFWLPLLAVFW